jgi:hypothetical protein
MRLKLHTAIMERPDGTLGVIRVEGEDEASFTNRVLWAMRALALAADAQCSLLEPPDPLFTRIRAAAVEAAASVYALGAALVVAEDAGKAVRS